MQLRPSTRMRAVLAIYRRLRKPRGGVLTRDVLEREWRKTGLRRMDLETALQDLLQRGLLQREAASVVAYELTYLGECAMRQPLHQGDFGALRDWLILQRARHRRRQSIATAPAGRRREDR